MKRSPTQDYSSAPMVKLESGCGFQGVNPPCTSCERSTFESVYSVAVVALVVVRIVLR